MLEDGPGKRRCFGDVGVNTRVFAGHRDLQAESFRRRKMAIAAKPNPSNAKEPGSGTTEPVAVMLSMPMSPLMTSPIRAGEAELRMRKSATLARSVANGCGELMGVMAPTVRLKETVCHKPSAGRLKGVVLE